MLIWDGWWLYAVHDMTNNLFTQANVFILELCAVGDR